VFPKIRPIIPVRRRELFESAEWVYELKHDGFRALAYITDGRCRLISRRGNEMKRFKDLSELLAKDLKATSIILDGEIVALDGTGKPAFYDLMKRQCEAVYYAFDILWLNGRDLRDLPLIERKKILRKVIPRKSFSVGCVSYVDRDALKLFELVKKQDLEGLVVKRKDGKYKAEQTLWYKILNPLHTENRPARIFPKAVVRKQPLTVAATV
jgi:bifunctional non-homologous end joining protein LigD